METFALLSLFALVAVSYGYTNEEAAAYADTNGDGIISSDEFTNWHNMAMAHQKTAWIFGFTGPINVHYFGSMLSYWQSQGYYPTEFSVDDAVNYANEDGDGVIDAYEFDKWYNGVIAYSAVHTKAAMEGEDGEISIADFVYVLDQMPS